MQCIIFSTKKISDFEIKKNESVKTLKTKKMMIWK